MKYKKKTVVLFILILTIGMTSMSACGFLGFGGSASWKEEVLLHDGKKIVIERFYHLGGRPTIDSTEKRNLDETVTFVLPGSSKKVTWKTEFRDEKPEQNSLDLLALDIVNGIPYIATNPRGCIAYNKWERPNPPYILFKYQDNVWKRISLEEFPAEISKVNVIVERPPAKLLKSFYTAEQVKIRNSNLGSEEYKTIVRSPIIKKGREGCPEVFFDGKYWREIVEFRKQPSYEACLKVCIRERFSNEYCPCSRLFNHNKKGE